jgi:hypothetical protein
MVKMAINEGPDATPHFVPFVPGKRVRPVLESYRFEVPTRREVEGLIGDVIDDLAGVFPDAAEQRRISHHLQEFTSDWGRAYARFGSSRAGVRRYTGLLGRLGETVCNEQLKARLNRHGKGYGSLAVLSTVFQKTNRIVSYAGESLLGGDEHHPPPVVRPDAASQS